MCGRVGELLGGEASPGVRLTAWTAGAWCPGNGECVLLLMP